MSILASFWKSEACGQTELLDRSVLMRQKLVENAKIETFKRDILGDFQTLCNSDSWIFELKDPSSGKNPQLEMTNRRKLNVWKEKSLDWCWWKLFIFYYCAGFIAWEGP